MNLPRPASLLGILALLAAASLFSAEPAPFQLKGKVALGDAYVFNVKPAAGRAEWLALGETIDGYTLAAFDHPMNTLTLKKGGTTLQVSMDVAAIKEAASPADRKQRNKERMLRMKPALEAGQPIRGDALVLANGSVVEQPTEFVIGQETWIEVKPGTRLLVAPKLNADGSVAYDLSLHTKGADGTLAQTESFPRITNTPWGGFTLSIGSSRVFGFQPHDDKP